MPLTLILSLLAQGRTPCGDREEDGSGLGLVRADCGTLVRYRYDRPDSPDDTFEVSSWEKNSL